ncbi:helix-turn-helix domain-containing protein [Streptomyces glomeratus]|uniref:HTH cro/C1-type domain-containing protein n=1 Tax=Streptomyces glomeratus TaxID=284452 RepID=A0ABP6LA10_9ACTN|nr:helix-turn-helix transcriptional regulator [Streptomyces glomeratus]MCF1507054.1 helix-turn-helix transcriptional regulator [Streptomyces glomeratus]
MMTTVGQAGVIRKIPRIFEKISIDNIEIMTTGRIELGASGRAVAANVKRLRQARGWSLRALSEALDGVGRKLSQDAINKIENGAKPDAKQIRRVDVDDLVALAAVLRVNPSALLLPLTDDPAQTIELTGVGEVDAERAWDWVDGEMPIEDVKPGDPTGAILQFQLYARPSGRRMQLGVGDGDG